MRYSLYFLIISRMEFSKLLSNDKQFKKKNNPKIFNDETYFLECQGYYKIYCAVEKEQFLWFEVLRPYVNII